MRVGKRYGDVIRQKAWIAILITGKGGLRWKASNGQGYFVHNMKFPPTVNSHGTLIYNFEILR